jgi:hypothetical protein
MKSNHSFRKQKNIQKAISLGLIPSTAPPNLASWKEIPALRLAAADPYESLETLILKDKTVLSQAGMEAFRAVGAGSSPWIQLTQYLVRQELEREGAQSK